MSDIDNVIAFPAKAGDFTADQALSEALACGLRSVIIVGYTPEDTLYIRSSGDVTRREALWMLENAKMNAVMAGDE